MVMPSGAFHSSQTLLNAPQARCARGQSRRECWGDSGVPALQVLQVGEIPITCSQVPIGRPWLRVNQIKVPTFLGRALCQILATTWGVVEFLKLRLLMNVMIPGECDGPFAFLYPLLAVYPKKGASPRGCVSLQCHSLGSQGRFSMKPDFKNPVGCVSLAGRGRISVDFEGSSMSFLKKNSDWGVVVEEEGVFLVARGPELSASRNSSEF